MKPFIFSVTMIHLVIVTLYVGLTSYIFVISKPPNPIGAGIVQWICIILHFLLTPIVAWLLLRKRDTGNVLTTKVLVNVFAVIFWVALFLSVSVALGRWLWSLRGDAIQIN